MASVRASSLLLLLWWGPVLGCPSGGSWEAQVAYPASVLVSNEGSAPVEIRRIASSPTGRAGFVIPGQRLAPGAVMDIEMTRASYRDFCDAEFVIYASCGAGKWFRVRGAPSMVTRLDAGGSMRVKVSLRLCGDAASETADHSQGEVPLR